MEIKRVLIVDDSSMYQGMLTEVIGEHPCLQVVGVAVNGREALQRIDELKPDVVTLDILMPQMDGIQTLIELRRNWPAVRTIMISSLTSEGSDAALDALTLGAHEYAVKPVALGGVRQIRETMRSDLLPKILALVGLERQGFSSGPGQDSAAALSPIERMRQTTRSHARGTDLPELVCIGVSTGGPDALTRLLMQMPADFEVPICIVQHMPPEFTSKLAARLDKASALSVCEASHGDLLRPAHVYIAPGDQHMVLERSGGRDLICLNRNPAENSCRPSVDPLFRSAAAIHAARCLGVVMTGMGQDGLRGAEVLYAAGAPILVQDEQSSVVWGMPRLVAQAGLADEQVSLQRMAGAIVDRVRGTGNTRASRMHRTSADDGGSVQPSRRYGS